MKSLSNTADGANNVEIQRTAEEAERRAALYPRFPGCSPNDRRRLDYQILRAGNLVRIAIADFRDEMSRSQAQPRIIA